MKKRTKILYILLMFVLAVFASAQNSNTKNSYPIKKDFVPDEKTAIKIAETIWLPIYGESIYTERPFKARLVESKVWIVEGTLKSGMAGGVAYIEIQKKDCKVLKVTHGK